MPKVRPEMGEMMKFAGIWDASRPKTAHERAFLARFGVRCELLQLVRVIFNQMLICSARPSPSYAAITEVRAQSGRPITKLGIHDARAFR